MPSRPVKLYQGLGFKSSRNVKAMPELNLKSKVLGWLIAARSGHGPYADYSDYHERRKQTYIVNVGRRSGGLAEWRSGRGSLARRVVKAVPDFVPFLLF